MEVKKITKQVPFNGDTRNIAQVVNNNAELLGSALNRIKELEKRMEDVDAKPLEIEEFKLSEGMTTKERAKVISLVRKAFDTWEEWEGDVNGEDDWSKEHKARDVAIKVIEQEPLKDAYTRQVVKERDLAIEQLNELGYSLGKKTKPCEKEQEPTLYEVIAEINKQEEWLAQAGYDAYNVCIAFGSIKRALRKLGELNDGIRRNG